MTIDSSTLPTAGSASPDGTGRQDVDPNRAPLDLSDQDDGPEAGPPENLGKRMLEPRTLASFAFAVLILVFTFRSLKIDPAEVWSKLRQANLGYLAVAFFMYYGALFLRGLRWKNMLARVGIDKAHGFDMPGPFGMLHIIILSWFANCVLPARLGDAYRSYLLKQKNGASFGRSLGTILAERLIDLVCLVLVLTVSGAIVFGTKVPHRAEQAFLLGVGVVAIGVVGAIFLWLARDQVERWLPDRISSHYQRLHDGIFNILRRPLPYTVVGLVLWITDGLRLMFVAKSLGLSLTLPEATMVALLSALVTIVPITPAGLGVVEGFMIWLLPQVGISGDSAAAVALLDRFVTYFSVIIIGIPLYLLALRSTVATKQTTPSASEPVADGHADAMTTTG
ncbi:MAG: lysylphosphatidylglycerol synthase transmembrane domain-containing protein [Thermomicrobiales bacterium]